MYRDAIIQDRIRSRKSKCHKKTILIYNEESSSHFIIITSSHTVVSINNVLSSTSTSPKIRPRFQCPET